jgi:hypothetical protein
MMQDAITVLKNIEKVQALLAQAIGLLGGTESATPTAPTAPAAKRRGRPPKSKSEDLDL